MLIVHHLQKSQSERIVWLCEELGVPYELKLYARDQTMLAPQEYKALHPIGAAPVITDGALILAESAAIVEYILAVYGNGRLTVPKGEPAFADYLYWFHFVNGTLQPAMMNELILAVSGTPEDHPVRAGVTQRRVAAVDTVERHLGETPFLAGATVSVADIMMVFPFTTMRNFLPFDLSGHPNIVAYLQRIAEQTTYLAAMAKSDPEISPLLS